MEIVENLDLKTKIGNTCFTIEFVLDSVKKNDKNYFEKFKNKILNNVKIERVGVGEGFLSHVYRCIFYFVDSSEEYSVILKVPTAEYIEDFESSLDDDFYIKLHHCECDFYNDIAPLLNIAIPKAYKALPLIENKHEGCILMEDLSGKGAVQKICSSLTIKQIKEITKQLAKFHAKILSTNEKIWKGKFMENQNIFEKLADLVAKYFTIFFSGTEKFLKYTNLIKNPKFFNYLFCQSYIDLNVKPVLCHGDLWLSNIMWKTDKNGQTTNELLAIIDWQSLMEGSPMMDLARLLATGTLSETRKQIESFIIDYYLDLLRNEMDNVPYTKEQLETCYYHGFLAYSFKFAFTGTLCIQEIDPNDPEYNLKIDILKNRCQNLIEDADKLLSGPLKNLYENYAK